MRNRTNHTIDADSNEFNAMFTPDGKLDFKSRIGISRDTDPLDRVQFKPDPRDGRVEFAEHRELRKSVKDSYRVNQFSGDDDTDYNERW